MTQWVAFATIVTLLTAAMVVLTRQTQRSLTPVEAGQTTALETPTPASATEGDRPTRSETATHRESTAVTEADGAVLSSTADRQQAEQPNPPNPPNDPYDPSTTPSEWDDGAVDPSVAHSERVDDSTGSANGTRSGRIVARVGDQSITSRALRWNVLATQLLFLAVVAGTIVLTGVPPDVLGISITRQGLVTGLGVGLGAGFGLYAASELAGAIGRRFGMTHDEWLRESLAPSRRRGWIVLFAVVLPVIAVFEELLFRAVLVGALSVGFGLSPWLLAVASSILFAVGHGVQGQAGVIVTGVIGFVLAATFIVTGNLLAVVVAHYVLNGCEFAVYEYLEFGSTRT
ncbi:putative metal-dependent membrane protease [Halovivax ruber XH-70]|uniref:Putative metal-dependent membrane protease n=1 Tax=Halovivax ruber (strain DSM 18193 / JCM 13892 / XH-70) TaxID=797302 RepID=L0IFZ6_HALRX|nr:type II CAAX endopeptidase family protein [Halovivax ruber]AGB16882.1 putative metal-dependent membrane protease [Halovivax ruber XH-70]